MNVTYQIFEIVEERLIVFRNEFDEEINEYDTEENAIEALKYTPAYKEFVVLKKYTKEPNLLDEIEGE